MSKVVQALTLTLVGRETVTIPATRVAKVTRGKHDEMSRIELRTPAEQIWVMETPEEVAALMNGAPRGPAFLTRAAVP